MSEKKGKKQTTDGQNKSRKEGRISRLYKIEDDKISRIRPTCERCGLGFFMADHGNRYTCGHCGFTKYKEMEE